MMRCEWCGTKGVELVGGVCELCVKLNHPEIDPGLRRGLAVLGNVLQTRQRGPE
jgi:NMD protein affecting ribosome stability and mRNA decay